MLSYTPPSTSSARRSCMTEFTKSKKKSEVEKAEAFIEAQLQKLRRTNEETIEEQ